MKEKFFKQEKNYQADIETALLLVEGLLEEKNQVHFSQKNSQYSQDEMWRFIEKDILEKRQLEVRLIILKYLLGLNFENFLSGD